MCQSHTGRLTGLWFLPKPAFGLNTNDDDDDIYLFIHLLFVYLLLFSGTDIGSPCMTFDDNMINE